jgi:hypothetical protein
MIANRTSIHDEYNDNFPYLVYTIEIEINLF